MQQGGDPPVAVAAVGSGEFDDVGGQRRFVLRRARCFALGGSVLAEDLAGPPLGHAKLGSYLLHAGAAASGA
jgi:hypothetical protein